MFTTPLTSLEKAAPQYRVYALCAASLAWGKALTALDKSAKMNLKIAAQHAEFSADFESSFVLTTPHHTSMTSLTLVGVGNPNKWDVYSWRKLGIALGQHMKTTKTKKATLMLEDLPGLRVTTDDVVEILEGIALVQYSFDTLKTKPKSKATLLESLSIAAGDTLVKSLKGALPLWQAQMEAVALTRDLVNSPANIVTPVTLAAEAKKLAKLGVKVEVYGPKELKKMGANLLLSVAAGSAHPAQMIVMKWMGAGKNAPLRAVVGKGVTFDTGGYSIKPREGMVGMKADMGGAAAVLGLMKALAARRSKVNVVGVCACAENMISDKATRVDDVIKALNGLTVEIKNTDAEGRLVLADSLSYIVKKEKPVEVLDIATLTMACMQALSAYYAGLFTPHDDLAAALTDAGIKTGERLWRLPMGPEFHKQNSSDVADLSNMPVGYGTASSAACFLENFVDKTRWAHLDIAGVGMGGKVPGVTTALSGATGFGVRLLLKYYEGLAK